MKKKSKLERNAESIYKSILKVVESAIGNDTTYSNDLDTVSRNVLGYKFRGVFPSDKLPKLNDLKPYAIVNLDRSTESGSHWVSLAKKNGKLYFYDSFGRNPKSIIKIADNGRILADTKDAEQGITENNCGARCIAFLIFFDRYGEKLAMLI